MFLYRIAFRVGKQSYPVDLWVKPSRVSNLHITFFHRLVGFKM